MASFNFADLLDIVATEVPDREAVICGDRRLTFAQLNERVSRLANWLQAQGIGKGDHVGLYLTNGTEYVEGFFGCARIGAVGVNVNYRYVEDELRYLFTDADLKGVIYNERYQERIDHVRDDCPLLKVFLAVGESDSPADSPYEAALAESPGTMPDAVRDNDDLYILYTGGTTGMPKGVMWRSEDAFYACFRGANPIGEPAATPEALSDIVRMKGGMQTAMMVGPPLMHGAAQWAMCMQLYGGDKIIIDPSVKFDAARVWKTIQDEKALSTLVVGDAMARPLVDELDRAEKAGTPYDLSSFFVLGSGGAIMSDVVKRQFHEKLPNLMILDSFGVSETGYQGGRPSGSSETDTGGPRFVMDATTTVLDDDLRPVEPGSGTVGMLARGGRIPLGYYKDTEKSAKTFVTDADGKRWSLPGDMATVEADGSITLLGRGSQCINTGGEKVYPEEVEAALKIQPAVFDATVVGVADDRWGQKVTAIVALRPGMSADKDSLVEHCREHIAGYKVPREVIVVDEITRSPSGKPDYRWAKALAEKTLAGKG